MDRQEINVALAAILTTALEIKPGEFFPCSMAYLALGSNIDNWNLIKEILLAAKLADISNDCITLTDKGRILAEKCNAVALSRKSKS
jgi:hypothetical protein